MNYKRLVLAAVVAWIADTIYGMITWILIFKDQFAMYPSVFRTEEAMNAHLPMMFAGAILAMFVLTYMYAKGYEGGTGVVEGFRFGILLGLFLVSFVMIGLYGSINIGGRISALAMISSFIEMVLVGSVIGVTYKPIAKGSTVITS